MDRDCPYKRVSSEFDEEYAIEHLSDTIAPEKLPANANGYVIGKNTLRSPTNLLYRPIQFYSIGV